jgi:hypothetical protein
MHTICITLKLKVEDIGMRRRRQRKNPIETHGTTNQKFVVSSFKLQQACDSKHRFIFINSIQAKHLSQIPHHCIFASSNHHILQWNQITNAHSIIGQNKQGIQERVKIYYKMWVQFTGLFARSMNSHYFPTSPDSLCSLNSFKIQWNHLMCRDTFYFYFKMCHWSLIFQRDKIV